MATEKPYRKPLPLLDDQDLQPFWEALRRHEFVLFRCKKCGAWYWPVAYCRFHGNEPFYGNMEWVKASGRGKVFAYNIHYRAFHHAFQGELPYVYALIELDEGPMISSNIVQCTPSAVSIGMPVEVVFEDHTATSIAGEQQFTLPMFRPVNRG